MSNSNVTRAEIYNVIAQYQQKLSPLAGSKARGSSELHSLLDRLRVAFCPNMPQMLLSAEYILLNYPPNPSLFRGWETLREDERNMDAERVSRAIAQNGAQIDCLRKEFLEMMKQIVEEDDWAMQVATVSYMESLAAQWGVYEGRIETVRLWFQRRWGMYRC